MKREYEKWFSKTLERDMEMLVFGHAGARVIVFPTSCGRFYDWENRGMLEPLHEHLENGWIQMFFVDSVDAESWWNTAAIPAEKAKRHLKYQQYVIDEVLPFSKKRNENEYVIALGASMGGYHAINLAMRYPQHFNRVIGMSGPYDMSQMSQPYPIFDWVHEHYDEFVLQCDPVSYINALNDASQIKTIKQLEIIFAIGRTDPLFPGNETFSHELWNKGIQHAYQVWNGFAHDWPYWKDMLVKFIGGVD